MSIKQQQLNNYHSWADSSASEVVQFNISAFHIRWLKMNAYDWMLDDGFNVHPALISFCLSDRCRTYMILLRLNSILQ